MKTITAAQFHATIGRGITNTSPVAKPYVSKQAEPRKRDVSALEASILRGKGLQNA